MKEKYNKYIQKIKIIKHRRKIIWLLFFLFSYLLFIFYAKKIETIMTFPAVNMNIADMEMSIEKDINFEEINITDSKGNNIN